MEWAVRWVGQLDGGIRYRVLKSKIAIAFGGPKLGVAQNQVAELSGARKWQCSGASM